MAWDLVEPVNDKATEKQIKYAETLLEQYYGDICFELYKMSKKEISKLIDETKKLLDNEKNKLSPKSRGYIRRR